MLQKQAPPPSPHLGCFQQPMLVSNSWFMPLWVSRSAWHLPFSQGARPRQGGHSSGMSLKRSPGNDIHNSDPISLKKRVAQLK
jgi:hypothetical protein